MEELDDFSSRKGADGKFSKLNLTLLRLQKLPLSCFLFINFSTQKTNETLPSSEAFVLGGADTIRGFPASSFLGDEGYFLNAELRFPTPFISRKWSKYLKWNVFYDYGSLSIINPQFRENEKIKISSFGGGAKIFFPFDFQISVDVGKILKGKSYKDKENLIYVKLNKKVL